ncbi:hypothetical protein [Gemmatimonas groenlandica]|uniref:Uncharacterized protein n=1 Tax=Gemmatimonas groenlandica TaxID=2732249 RepID=A0A6M4IU09_9BACT|nr:hypothetical protein [Gemmatimonas groenlandica]QJR37618.1 hypothetical protein HKW67_19895 [Gemmatimonas groenlandica]
MIVASLGTLTACRDVPGTNATATANAGADVPVTVRAGAIVAPDSVRPGWARVRVNETDGEHIVVVFRLPASTTAADVPTFVAALDTAPATPRPGVALGGPEVGSRGDVIVHLTPGVYVLACVRRGDDGHRHAYGGESRIMHVRAGQAADSMMAAPPPSTQTVRLIDFAFVGPDHWAPGVQLLRIENTGPQDHQIRLARVRDGASVQAWMAADDPDTVATTIAGMARVGAGEVAYLPIDLIPGTYIAYCLVADAATKRPHVELGMLRTIHVP